MRILHLTLKKQWFVMIASGEKKEEYREIKPYWINRLAIDFLHIHNEDGKMFLFEPKTYDVVRFTNGYGKQAPSFDIECKGIRIGEGKTEWGAEPNTAYFIISLDKTL